MTTSNAEIENSIINFLHEHGENYFTCALATCSNNMPRNTPVDARNDGLTMYFVSDQGQKLENMKKKGTKFVPGKVIEWLDCGNKDATVYTNRRVLEMHRNE